MARERVERLVGAGLPLGEAIRAEVERQWGTLAAWSARRAWHRSYVTHLLNGTGRGRYPRVRRALAADLGVSRDLLDRWLDGIRQERQERQEREDRAREEAT